MSCLRLHQNFFFAFGVEFQWGNPYTANLPLSLAVSMAMDSQIINPDNEQLVSLVRSLCSAVSSLNDTHLIFDTGHHITPIFFFRDCEKNIYKSRYATDTRPFDS